MTATSEQQLTLPEARAYLLERARERGVTLEVYGERTNATSIRAFEGDVSEFKLSARQGVAAGPGPISRGSRGATPR